jgi:hypothetical protein
MPTISLSPSFFTKELQAYSDWRSAFWRELVQNSVDASCSTIKITIRPEGEGCAVTFHDNGPGMTRETLEQVYFVVGETTKVGHDSIGGFGRARVLTCFGHAFWKISTNQWRCTGSGTLYEISPSAARQEGCLVEVTIVLATAADMACALDLYLESCQLGCEVWINRALFNRWAYRNRIAGKLSFGKVFVNKSKARYSVLVRVNGVQMFSRYTQAAWQIVIEIDPARSREILTSNRDGLTSCAVRELDDFIGSIWVSPASAVRPRHQSFQEDCGAPVYRVRKRRRAEDEGAGGAAGAGDGSQTQMVQEAVGPAAGYLPLCETSLRVSRLRDPNSSLQESSSRAGPGPGFVLSVACGSRVLLAAANLFRPEVIGGRRLKLLEQWTAACKLAAEEFADLEDDAFAFRTGFTFVEDDLASCSLHSGIGDLLLRPINLNGRLAYKLSSSADRSRLLALAAHEVVHLRYREHDEFFARALTMLIGRLLDRRKAPPEPSFRMNPKDHSVAGTDIPRARDI